METSPIDALRSELQGEAPVPDRKSAVDRDSFLNLLVTQLRNQDPLEPVENTEFISQLATFQSLESQISMGQRLEDLVSLQESQLALAGLSQAALLVGKHVTWIDGDGKAGAGTIESVTVENGVMMVNTKSGKVPVGALTSIAVPPSADGSGGEDDSGSDPDDATPAPPAGATPGSPALTASVPPQAAQIQNS